MENCLNLDTLTHTKSCIVQMMDTHVLWVAYVQLTEAEIGEKGNFRTTCIIL